MTRLTFWLLMAITLAFIAYEIVAAVIALIDAIVRVWA